VTGPFDFSASPQWIAWDLGSDQNIGSFHLWNGNQQGASRMVSSAEMYLISSLPAYGASLPSGTLVWSGSVSPATLLPTYTGADYSLNSPTSGQYFLMNVTGSSGGTGNQYASLSEIRFVTAAEAQAVPEPAGLGLIGIALLALRKRRS